MRFELRVSEEEDIFEGDRAPLEAVFGSITITTAGAILCVSLALGVLGEKGCP